MVKATLRSSANPPATIDVESEEIKDANLANMIAEEAGATADEMTAAGATTATPAPTMALEPRKPAAVANRQLASTEGFDGEWDSSDLKFPQLKLVQGSGPLSAQYDIGTLVYADEMLFEPPSKKPGAVNPLLRFVPLVIQKQWREKLSQDDIGEGARPRVVDTIEQVEEFGGVTRWVGNEQPDNYWEPSARCLLLIERPEGNEHPGFAVSLDGKDYAVAVYYAGGGSYRDFARTIFNVAKISLTVPMMDGDKPKVSDLGRIVKHVMLYKNFWTVFFKQITTIGKFTPWRPQIKLQKQETGPEVRAYCEEVLRGATPAAVDAD